MRGGRREKELGWTKGGQRLDGGGSEDEWRMHEGRTEWREVMY